MATASSRRLLARHQRQVGRQGEKRGKDGKGLPGKKGRTARRSRTPRSQGLPREGDATGQEPAGIGDPKSGEMYRWYEVKPKDTLQTIARENLGSSQRWQEIKKLNPGLDPQKMKPGERIKVPRAKPVFDRCRPGKDGGMTIPRMLVLLVGLSAIGIAVVAIRVEEGRVLRRIQEYQREETEARQEIRAQEMKLWTLRSPPTIRERAAQLGRRRPLPPVPRAGAKQGTARNGESNGDKVRPASINARAWRRC